MKVLARLGQIPVKTFWKSWFSLFLGTNKHNNSRPSNNKRLYCVNKYCMKYVGKCFFTCQSIISLLGFTEKYSCGVCYTFYDFIQILKLRKQIIIKA